jgi:hypothetical protein
MAGSSRDTMNKLLRTVYKYSMREHFTTRAVLLQILGRQAEENYSPGKVIDMPLHVALGGGFSFSSRGQLPPAGHQIVERALFNYTMMTDRFEITEDLEQDTSSNMTAEKKILDMETSAIVRGGRRGLCYHLYDDGTGSVGNPLSASDAVTLVVDDIRGIADNMRVDILKHADGSTGGGVIGAQVRVERATKTLTLQDGKAMADFADVNANPTTYKVYRHGSRNDAVLGFQAWFSASNPPTGVPNIGGLDRTLAANDFWRATVFSSTVPREPALPLIQAMFDEIEEHIESDTSLAICHPSTWNWIAYALDAQKRFTHTTGTYRAWIQSIYFGDMKKPILKDFLCPPGFMFFFDPMVIKIAQINEGDWMQQDGAVLSRIPNFVAYEGSWFRRLQLICEKPKALGVIQNIVTNIPG